MWLKEARKKKKGELIVTGKKRNKNKQLHKSIKYMINKKDRTKKESIKQKKKDCFFIKINKSCKTLIGW